LKSQEQNQNKSGSQGLIETWDVLKFAEVMGFAIGSAINRNMGCIEIG